MIKRNSLLNNRLLAALICALLVSASTFGKGLSVANLHTEYHTNPIGLETPHPRMSWEITSTDKNVMQSAYQLRAAHTEKELLSGKNLLFDSQKQTTDQSVHIAWQGSKLTSGERVYWQVKVWDNKGKATAWSTPAFWEMGLLNQSDWSAKWIESTVKEDVSVSTPSAMMRKQFALKKEVKSAKVYATAHGLYELFLNGKKVSDQLFTPGWTTYQKRLQYQVYDVTNMVQNGNNAIGAILGDGWYRGYLIWQGNKNTYGEKSALLLQMTITYTDGSQETINTDESWSASTGAILKSDIYNGETYDARLEQSGWSEANFDASAWKSVATKDYPMDNLVPSVGEKVCVTETIKPIKKIITPKGEIVFDLGQNMVGWVRFHLKGEKGSKITLHHAEVLDKEGNFYIDNLRVAKAEDTYIFKGEGIETYEPRFTFHGFRYIRVSDYKGDVTIDDLEGRVVHSDMAPTGDFTCSNALINRLQKNIQWGLRGNFLDVPTDCPQRDERLGWTGDAQVFAPTACFNMNTASFYTKWMKDFSAEQREDGSIPWVVPNVVPDGGGTGWSDGFGATGWADAAVIIPWAVYQAYGDKQILKDQYASMKGWVDYMRNHASTRYIFDYGFHFGDWLSFAEYYTYNYNAPDFGYAGAHTDKDLIATAYFYYTCGIFEKMATALGNTDDAKAMADIRPKIQQAFLTEFMTKTGRLTSNTQTAYTLALQFGLIPDEMQAIAAKRLADDVSYFGHLTTGFLGTPLICQALTENGYPELAYKLLFNKRYPSWLYAVTMGATTIWERWDGIKPDSTFQDVGMNSFNHYAYGAVGNWLYTEVAGLQIDESKPGYKHIIVKPNLTDSLSFAKAEIHTMYGDASSEWRATDEGLTLSVTIPVNTTATIHIPASSADMITIDGKTLAKAGYTPDTTNETYVAVNVGSGNYKFEISGN